MRLNPWKSPNRWFFLWFWINIKILFYSCCSSSRSLKVNPSNWKQNSHFQVSPMFVRKQFQGICRKSNYSQNLVISWNSNCTLQRLSNFHRLSYSFLKLGNVYWKSILRDSSTMLFLWLWKSSLRVWNYLNTNLFT